MTMLCGIYFPSFVFEQRVFPTDPVEAFTRMFAHADEHLKQVKQKSGSMSVPATVLDSVLLAGNIGDSESVLA